MDWSKSPTGWRRADPWNCAVLVQSVRFCFAKTCSPLGVFGAEWGKPVITINKKPSPKDGYDMLWYVMIVIYCYRVGGLVGSPTICHFSLQGAARNMSGNSTSLGHLSSPPRNIFKVKGGIAVWLWLKIGWRLLKWTRCGLLHLKWAVSQTRLWESDNHQYIG